MAQGKDRVAARTWIAVLAAWMPYVALDFLGHGVLLAPYWDATAQSWRPDAGLFRLIPLAYATMAAYCGVLVWLLRRVWPDVRTLDAGALAGATVGLVFGAISWTLTYTAIPIPLSAVVVFTLWGVVASGGAGAAAAVVLGAERPRRMLAIVAGSAVALAVIAVTLQNAFDLA